MKKRFSCIASVLIIILSSCSTRQNQQSSKVDYDTLDSFWECDYFKISKNSNWNERENINGFMTSVYWDCNGSSQISITSAYNQFSFKLTQNELIEKIKGYQNSDDEIIREMYSDYEIEDTFVKNGQAYILLQPKDSKGRKIIEFNADKVNGSIYFYESQEDVVMKMIDSIEFYEIKEKSLA